jgi:hypothetical protein
MPIREKRALLRSLFMPGSKKFWSLKTEHARVLFCALLTQADDQGRLEGDPEDVKSMIPRANWPLEHIKSYLKDLQRVQLIHYYKVAGHWYVEVINFWEHQDKHGVSQVPSAYPGPTDTMLPEHHNGVSGTPVGVLGGSYNDLVFNKSVSLVNQSSPEQEFDFGIFRKKWQRTCGRSPQASSNNLKLFDEACKKYGQESVLKRIEPWCEAQSKEFIHKPVAVWKFLKEGVYETEDPLPPKAYPLL